MEISDELRDQIMTELEYYRPGLAKMKPIESLRSHVDIPILLGGVIDVLRYNVAEQRFEEVRICVATEGIMTSDMLPEGAAFCDKFKMVSIPLPEDWLDGATG